MVELQKNVDMIDAAGLEIVGISYDSVEVLAEFTDKRKITFPLLSDPDSEVIKSYGVLNAKATGKQEGVPDPGTFLIDRTGIIRAHIPSTVRERHSIETLLQTAQDKLRSTSPPADRE